MSVTTVRPATCPSWCTKKEPHEDEDGHWTEVGSEDLRVLFDSSRVMVGLYEGEPHPSVSVDPDVEEPRTTSDHLRDLAQALSEVADRIDAMIGTSA